MPVGDLSGVVLTNLTTHKDRPDVDQPDVVPGSLTELARVSDIGTINQTNVTEAYTGCEKRNHKHTNQKDTWVFLRGIVDVILFDDREGSSTFGYTMVLHIAVPERLSDLMRIEIPPGVAHGYRVIEGPCWLVYCVDYEYGANGQDEIPLDPDDPRIEYNWDA